MFHISDYYHIWNTCFISDYYHIWNTWVFIVLHLCLTHERSVFHLCLQYSYMGPKVVYKLIWNSWYSVGLHMWLFICKIQHRETLKLIWELSHVRNHICENWRSHMWNSAYLKFHTWLLMRDFLTYHMFHIDR